MGSLEDAVFKPDRVIVLEDNRSTTPPKKWDKLGTSTKLSRISEPPSGDIYKMYVYIYIYHVYIS